MFSDGSTPNKYETASKVKFARLRASAGVASPTWILHIARTGELASACMPSITAASGAEKFETKAVV